MELELLIEKITRDVLSKTNVNSILETKNEPIGESVMKRILVLIPDFAICIEKYLKYIIQSNEKCILVLAYNGELEDLKYRFSEGIEFVNTKDETGKLKLINSLDIFQAVYCISPGIKLLEAISLLEDTSFIENLIIGSALRKKNTKIMLDYNIDDLGLNLLAKKVKELMSTINSLGIKLETICSVDQAPDSHLEEDNSLIIEKDIEEFKKQGRKTIYCGKGTIITPLALDKAKELDIMIILKDR